MTRVRLLSRAAVPASAAVLGAGLALGVAAGLGAFDRSTTTIIRQVAAPTAGRSQTIADETRQTLTVGEIFRRSAPGVVQVTTTSVVQEPADPFFGNPFGGQSQTQRALGSGFVLDKAGHIVTNYHVVQGAKTVEVSFSNNDSMKATIVGADPSTDIAVLQVKTRSRALTPLALGNSDTVQVGDEVVAIGNPFGLDRTVTSGIVSAIQRQIQAPNGFSIDHAIQTDAALNHGNSGGPLLDARGDVIGVNSQIETGGTTDGNVGIGFAVPINTVRNVAAQIIRDGRVEHAYLGVSVRSITPELARLFRLPTSAGLLVEKVGTGSAAGLAGLRGGTTQVVVAGESYVVGGDLIVRAGGQAVTSTDKLREIVAAHKPGQPLKLQIFRGDRKLDVTVKLGRQPVTAMQS